MSYLVLARKWRPTKFSEVVGQDHAVEALKNSVSSKNIHHAYLFTGTRGIGKTSIARILAKALNCSQSIDNSEPCNACESCTSINEGAAIDFIEIDAASRRGIEDTKNLLETISYLPSSSKYKIYLIDEVHMLTTESFNALLKNLEEPPPHVIFMFATTEYKKILPTIISRCLQINLSSVSEKVISDQLGEIFSKEKIKYDDNSLKLIAQAAQGSIRDALSISEKVISFCNRNIKEEEVREVLGIPEPEIITNLLKSILDEDVTEVLSILENYGEYEDHEFLLKSLMDLVQDIAISQFEKKGAKNVNDFLKTDPAKLQFIYQLGLSNLKHFSLGYDSYSILKMTLLKMVAFSPENQKKNFLKIKKQVNVGIVWPGIFSDLNLNGISKNLLKQASVIQQENNIKLSFPKNVLSILNEDQKKDIEKSFEDYLKMELVFFYDDDVDPKLTPENEEKNKDKGIRRNIKKTMEKDKNFNEIIGGLKVDSVKFNKKNETKS
ncbi:DNA polymerase III subunit gamma/tau [Gammaproteobacteria bacterium]|nr:DNA polymerase III subunit gamma/tau [Gammaproteobacteria bacterium]